MAVNVCAVLDLTKVKSLPFEFGVNGKDYALISSKEFSKHKVARAEGRLDNLTISNLPVSKTCQPRKIKVADTKRLSAPDENGELLPVCVVKK